MSRRFITPRDQTIHCDINVRNPPSRPAMFCANFNFGIRTVAELKVSRP